MAVIAAALGLVGGAGLALVLLRSTQASPKGDAPAALETSPGRNPLTTGLQVMDRLDALLARAGWGDMSAPAVASVWAVGSVIAGAVVVMVLPLWVLGPLTTCSVVLAGVGVLRSRIDRRERALRAVWPGVVDYLRQAVRSGAGVGEAVRALRDVVPPELRPAFATYQQSL